MPKAKTQYVCQNCGAKQVRWQGQCDACGAWNTLVEEVPESQERTARAAQLKPGAKLQFVDLRPKGQSTVRQPTQLAELDRVLGGGLVRGSAILLGGDPGIGKSTLLLQVAARLGAKQRVLYISAEESVEQITLRAERLGVSEAPVSLASAASLASILTSLQEGDPPGMVVIDSIQTVFADILDSAPGTVAQVRFCAHELIRLAKKIGFALVLVGHVTKEGTLAGPRVLEHMVDTVLYFEGERGYPYRILRTVKNRFGATDEIGVFAMGEQGLEEVENPSALFLSDRQERTSGAVVFAGMEGTRPILVEIQALAAPSPLGTPRRTAVGWDQTRLSMLLAVLETRAGASFANKDIFLNVAGGLKIREPAADLAVAVALLSALQGVPLSPECLFFGELGLGGEVRGVGYQEQRLREGAKLGFKAAVCPVLKKASGYDLELTQMRHIQDVARLVQ